ncbi:MAG: sugar transferase [Alphaproteobacteria bacterium]|nr:MAG: sugar transferase [Alphaproteobacteria bacterium]
MSDQTVNFAEEPLSRAAISTSRAGQTRTASFYQRRGKRLLDVVLAALLLVLALPLLGALIMLIRCDGGPALFAQTRVGRGGRHFRCLKLRSMVPDAEASLDRLCAADPAIRREWQSHQKLARDPRVTPLGRLLRATSLDELPQLFNVLRGEMSLVGPRPFTPEQEAAYRQAGGRAYFAHRPGLTGPWQVSERARGGFVGRIAHDERYLAQVTLARDLWLIARTFGAVLRCTGQ